MSRAPQSRGSCTPRRLVQIYLERREAIAKQADVRLTRDAVVMLPRDAAGELIVTTETTKSGTIPSLPSVTDDAAEAPPAPQTVALPPVPGGLPSSEG